MKKYLVGIIAVMFSVGIASTRMAFAGHGHGNGPGGPGPGGGKHGNAVGEEFFDTNPHGHGHHPTGLGKGHEEKGHAVGEEFFETNPHGHGHHPKGLGVGHGNPKGPHSEIIAPVGPAARLDFDGPYFRRSHFETFHTYFGPTNIGSLPPGLRKHIERTGHLPPGLEKQLVRNGHLPPGLEHDLEPLPPPLITRFGPLPPGTGLYVYGRNAILVNNSTRTIVDVMPGIY